MTNLYLGDCVEVLRKNIVDNSIDLVVTSPPYDNLRKYGGDAALPEDKFQDVAKELYRLIKDGGVVVWVVNDASINGSKTGTSFRQALFFQSIGFNINDVMIWQKKNPMPVVKQPRYQDVFEYMFVFSKGKPKTFNPIMVPCKCAGLSYDSTCKNMGGECGRTKKSFEINKEKVDSNIWQIAIAQNKTGHPAVFPEELARKHVLSWSNEGDIVLDPFMGSGTVGIVCKGLNRDFIGIDINQEYVEMAKHRIETEDFSGIPCLFGKEDLSL